MTAAVSFVLPTFSTLVVPDQRDAQLVRSTARQSAAYLYWATFAVRSLLSAPAGANEDDECEDSAE